MTKRIKSFRLSDEQVAALQILAQRLSMSEGEVVGAAIIAYKKAVMDKDQSFIARTPDWSEQLGHIGRPGAKT